MQQLEASNEAVYDKDLLAKQAWKVKVSPVDLGYKAVPNRLKMPEGWALGQVAGVEADSTNRLYVFHRGDEAPSLLCFDPQGHYLFSWEHISFGRPHMVLCDVEDHVWLIDDGAHIIYKLSAQGDILFTLGTKDVPGKDKTHFNQPTDLAFGPRGEIYVSDGYGNKRIAKFDAAGHFITAWGSEGTEPGQFALPHAIGTDKAGIVYCADRENWRVQVFDPDGTFLQQWTHIGRPSDLKYVPGEDAFYVCDEPNHRVTRVATSGEILGFFAVPGAGIHAVTVAPNSDLYVGLVSGSVSKFTKRR